MSYTVWLQGSILHPSDEVQNYLSELPGIRSDAGIFRLTDNEMELSAEIRLHRQNDSICRLEIYGAELTADSAERLAIFTHSLALHLGWVVQDPITRQELPVEDLKRRFYGSSAGSKRSGCLGALLGMELLQRL